MINCKAKMDNTQHESGEFYRVRNAENSRKKKRHTCTQQQVISKEHKYQLKELFQWSKPEQSGQQNKQNSIKLSIKVQNQYTEYIRI